MIPVTKPFLPDINLYKSYVDGIWQRQWLTNHGPLVEELEEKLKEYLNVKHLLFVSNGTIALQLAIKALDLKGEIITTPFSYVATTTSILWENCTPVFVDIEPGTYSINPALIEDAITSDTTAILATHVFGNPCDIDAIHSIASKHGLQVIYDGAHTFGVQYKGKSLLSYGDVSTCSFHATKIFHTTEGGAVICNDKKVFEKIYLYRSFGHLGDNYQTMGVNGKNSELHAAMGLSVLPSLREIIEKRKQIMAWYDAGIDASMVEKIRIRENTEWNYSYYPVLFKSEKVLLAALKKLNDNSIFPRRYFYPSLNTLKYVQSKKMPVSEDISQRILCLPLYFELSKEDVSRICFIITNSMVTNKQVHGFLEPKPL